MNTSKVKITETVPLFDVADVDKSIAFYVDGLGFELQDKWVEDDVLKWCRVEHGDSALMLQKSPRRTSIVAEVILRIDVP